MPTWRQGGAKGQGQGQGKGNMQRTRPISEAKVVIWSRQGQWEPKGLGSGLPKTTLWFNISLEKFTEPSKMVILTVTVYYSKRIQITIGNRKRSTRRAQESSRHELPDVLSQWSHLDSAYCPGNDVWQHTQSIASQGSSPELWCLVCIGGSHVGLDHQHDGTLISSHPRGHQC